MKEETKEEAVWYPTPYLQRCERCFLNYPEPVISKIFPPVEKKK